MDLVEFSVSNYRSITESIYYKKLFQCIWKKLKKYGLTTVFNEAEAIELAFNLKSLCFIDPNTINETYKKQRKNIIKLNIKNLLIILIRHVILNVTIINLKYFLIGTIIKLLNQ